MNIRTFKKLDNAIYQVSVSTEDWSQGDLDLMAKFGEPQIDIGGVFAGLVYVDFTLPNLLVNIRTDSPFTHRFDSRDYADAGDRANVWAAAIVEGITEAVLNLRALADTFTREEVTTI